MIDPNELERLSKALAVVIEAAEPMRLKEQADCLLGTKHRNPIQKAIETLRTNQLVPVQQPSGDVVEAVARAIRRDEIGGFSDEEVAQAVVDGSWEHKQPAALAAITTYEALRAKDTRP